MDVASPRKSPLLFQHCYCNSSTVKLFLSCLSHIISSRAHTFKWKMLRTIRQAKNKRAVSPRRKTACSRCSWFTLISPLGPFNTSHTPEGRIRATDEAWTMKHFSALFPTTPTPQPQTPKTQEGLPHLMKFQVMLRGLSEWLHWPVQTASTWASEENGMGHRAAPCAGDSIRGSHYLPEGCEIGTTPAEKAASHTIYMKYTVLGPPQSWLALILVNFWIMCD